MSLTFLFDPIKILYSSHQKIITDAVLIQNDEITAFGQEAREIAKNHKIPSKTASQALIAPCLVDPHSFLINPLNGKNETLKCLKAKAAIAGYGQIALLPKAEPWRDQPEMFNGFNKSTSDISIHLWGSLSLEGKGQELAPHGDLIQNGAIGIAECESIPSNEILRKALLVNEIGKHPILLQPRDPKIQGNGVTRESVETLRAGWPPDPIESETLPLSQLIELQNQYPNTSIRIMNLSTAKSISLLSKSNPKPMASVSWWHLVSDISTLKPTQIGWRVLPSLGSSSDRKELINAIKEKTLTAIAVNSIALNESDIIGPPEERSLGISGYQLVLPSLWNELIIKAKWEIENLWDALSFGPSRMLNSFEESLCIGSRRWLIFDPNKKWIQKTNRKNLKYAANEPFENKTIVGKIIHCGLKA